LAGPGARPDPAAPMRLRIDKWLWQARFFRNRSLAAAVVEAGHLRVNGQRVQKPGHAIAPGDTLTFPQANRIRLVRVTALGQRRGPAGEAQQLYLDLDETAAPDAESA
jgi:ribosome-associated heat shock protein Hsp15